MLGLSWGYAAQQATALPAADHAAGQRLIEQLLEPTGAGLLLYFGGGLLWLATVLAVVCAHLGRVSTGPLWLIGSGALVFVAGHASPTGPIGMGLFLAGVIWLERQRSSTLATRSRYSSRYQNSPESGWNRRTGTDETAGHGLT